MTERKANDHCCEEAAPGFTDTYVPCNAPATMLVGWPSRGEKVYRMCAPCADHNVHNRSATIMGTYEHPDADKLIAPAIELPPAIDIVTQYIALRNHVDAMTKKFKEDLKPYTDAMEALENAANMLLIQTGQKGLSTTAGTAFYKNWTSVKNEDPAKFQEFLIAGSHWSALTAHVSKEFVETWMENNDGHPPPGISVTRGRRVEFRKA